MTSYSPSNGTRSRKTPCWSVVSANQVPATRTVAPASGASWPAELSTTTPTTSANGVSYTKTPVKSVTVSTSPPTYRKASTRRLVSREKGVRRSWRNAVGIPIYQRCTIQAPDGRRMNSTTPPAGSSARRSRGRLTYSYSRDRSSDDCRSSHSTPSTSGKRRLGTGSNANPMRCERSLSGRRRRKQWVSTNPASWSTRASGA